MDCTETMIRKLCIDYSRRKDVCKNDLPTYTDAYRCKWDEAQRELRKFNGAFEEG